MLKASEYCYASNTAVSADNVVPMFRTSCETEMHIGNMPESEWLYVRVATLLRSKYGSTLSVI